MTARYRTIAGLLEDTARRVTRDRRAWTGYLGTASRLYAYPFEDQLLIHAQRPGAVMCAEIGAWNRRDCRVRRGSTGIALLDMGRPSRLRYVFDISDVYAERRGGSLPWVWRLLSSRTSERRSRRSTSPREPPYYW